MSICMSIRMSVRYHYEKTAKYGCEFGKTLWPFTDLRWNASICPLGEKSGCSLKKKCGPATLSGFLRLLACKECLSKYQEVRTVSFTFFPPKPWAQVTSAPITDSFSLADHESSRWMFYGFSFILLVPRNPCKSTVCRRTLIRRSIEGSEECDSAQFALEFRLLSQDRHLPLYKEHWFQHYCEYEEEKSDNLKRNRLFCLVKL